MFNGMEHSHRHLAAFISSAHESRSFATESDVWPIHPGRSPIQIHENLDCQLLKPLLPKVNRPGYRGGSTF